VGQLSFADHLTTHLNAGCSDGEWWQTPQVSPVGRTGRVYADGRSLDLHPGIVIEHHCGPVRDARPKDCSAIFPLGFSISKVLEGSDHFATLTGNPSLSIDRDCF
jgi:hypothetical protein